MRIIAGRYRGLSLAPIGTGGGRHALRPTMEMRCQIAKGRMATGYDRVVRRQAAHAAQGSVSFWSYRGGRFVAVEAMNAPRDYVVGRQMLERRVSPAPEAMAEGTTNLKALLRV